MAKKANAAAKRNRSMYKAKDQRTFNKLRKAAKEHKKNLKLLKKRKGIYVGNPKYDELVKIAKGIAKDVMEVPELVPRDNDEC